MVLNWPPSRREDYLTSLREQFGAERWGVLEREIRRLALAARP